MNFPYNLPTVPTFNHQMVQIHFKNWANVCLNGVQCETCSCLVWRRILMDHCSQLSTSCFLLHVRIYPHLINLSGFQMLLLFCKKVIVSVKMDALLKEVSCCKVFVFMSKIWSDFAWWGFFLQCHITLSSLFLPSLPKIQHTMWFCPHTLTI